LAEFVVPLVKAVQEQQEEIKANKKDIAILIATVNELKTRLEKLKRK
jgi:cell division protein FtsB